MSSEAVQDIALREVEPTAGKGALGKWRAPVRKHRLDTEPASGEPFRRCRAEGITVHPRGVCERALNPRGVREDPSGIAAAANRTREIRPSGMRGGLEETWPMRNCAPMSCYSERNGNGNPPLRMRAPRFYPTVAADKAAILRVRVPPCQLPEAGT
jgi:hypothetical protein